MERTVFFVLLVFLPMLVPSSLQETETHGNVQDPCGELKQLRELVYQQVATLSEIKVKMMYMEKEFTGEMKNITLPFITLTVSAAVQRVSALYRYSKSVCRN